MLNLSALLGIITTLSLTTSPTILCSDNDFNIIDHSMSLEGNVVNGTIDIYSGSNKFYYTSSSFLRINWSVKIEFYYDVQDKEFDGANIYGFLENVSMNEKAYYQYELDLNLLNGRQYSTLESQLYWTEDFFEINDYFALIEDINADEVANVTWADYNNTAIIDFDFAPFGDYEWISFYNIWSFSELYEHVDTLNSLYSINVSDSYASGYNSGYNTGYNDGYDVGYTANVENVASQKYQEGYTKGYDDGYHVNVGEGLSVQNILYSIVTMPSTIIKQGFDFDILGINVGSLIQTALVIGLVVFAIGMFKKG